MDMPDLDQSAGFGLSEGTARPEREAARDDRIGTEMHAASVDRRRAVDRARRALDVTNQVQILDLARELQTEKGTAVLFITHDMGVFAEVADRTVVMYQGAQSRQARPRPSSPSLSNLTPGPCPQPCLNWGRWRTSRSR